MNNAFIIEIILPIKTLSKGSLVKFHIIIRIYFQAVFNIEYVSNHKITSNDNRKCTHGQPHGMKTQFKDMDVTSWAHYCPGQTTIVG